MHIHWLRKIFERSLWKSFTNIQYYAYYTEHAAISFLFQCTIWDKSEEMLYKTHNMCMYEGFPWQVQKYLYQLLYIPRNTETLAFMQLYTELYKLLQCIFPYTFLTWYIAQNYFQSREYNSGRVEDCAVDLSRSNTFQSVRRIIRLPIVNSKNTSRLMVL